MRSYKTYPHASARRALGLPADQTTRTLLVYYLSQGVSEFDWGAAGPAAVTAANAAAATQRSPAAGASEGLRSQVKNLAFPPFLILQDTCLCPGLVYIPSPGSMSRCISKFFSQKTGILFQRLHAEDQRARPVTPDRGANKNGRNLSFFTGVSEFDCWARCASWLQEIPAAGSGNFFGSFREFLRSFEEFGFVSCAPGAGRLAGKLSTAYPQLSLY